MLWEYFFGGTESLYQMYRIWHLLRKWVWVCWESLLLNAPRCARKFIDEALMKRVSGWKMQLLNWQRSFSKASQLYSYAHRLI